MKHKPKSFADDLLKQLEDPEFALLFLIECIRDTEMDAAARLKLTVERILKARRNVKRRQREGGG